MNPYRNFQRLLPAIISLLVISCASPPKAPSTREANEALSPAHSAGDESGDAETGTDNPSSKLRVREGDSPNLKRAIRACLDGKYDGCDYAGATILGEQPTRAELDRAIRFWSRSCEADSVKGCSALGYVHVEPAFERVDYQKAAPFFHKACTLGDVSSCQSLLGLLGRAPDAVELGSSDRIAVAERVCKDGHPDACAYLGWLISEESPNQEALSEAANAYETGCERGSLPSCEKLVEVYRFGYGRSRDPKRAFALAQRLCTNDDWAGACHTLGILYAAGDGVSDDDKKAAQLYHKACELGDAEACVDYAGRVRKGWAIKRDTARGLELIKQTCASNKSPRACWLEGIYHRDGSATPKDIPKALTLFVKSCNDGSAAGCREGARLLSESPKLSEQKADDLYQRAAKLYRASCERNHGRSCGALADLYEAGRGVAKDAEVAAKLDKKACRLDPRECGGD